MTFRRSCSLLVMIFWWSPPSLIAPSPSGGSQSGPSGGSLQCRAARFLSREASYGGGLPRVSPLRVGIVTHNAAANRLTLPFLPRLRPVANGGFFLKRRPPPRVGLVRAPARIGGIDSPKSRTHQRASLSHGGALDAVA